MSCIWVNGLVTACAISIKFKVDRADTHRNRGLSPKRRINTIVHKIPKYTKRNVSSPYETSSNDEHWLWFFLNFHLCSLWEPTMARMPHYIQIVAFGRTNWYLRAFVWLFGFEMNFQLKSNGLVASAPFGLVTACVTHARPYSFADNIRSQRCIKPANAVSVNWFHPLYWSVFRSYLWSSSCKRCPNDFVHSAISRTIHPRNGNPSKSHALSIYASKW